MSHKTKEESVSSNLFNALFQTVLDPLIVADASGTIILVNDAVVQTFGWSSDELIGQSLNCLMPKHLAAQHDDFIERYLTTGKPHVINMGRKTEAQHKSGRTFPIHLSLGHCVVDGTHYFTGLIRDLSSEQQVIDAMERQKKLLRAVLNSPEEVILVFDAQGRIVLANHGAKRLLAIDETKSLVGCSWTDLFSSDFAHQYAQLVSDVFRTGRSERLTHSFSGRYFDTQFSPMMDDTGQVEFVTCFSLDITQLKHSKSRILKESKKAELANRAKTEFLANMSHELRTPLNSVLGFTQILKEDKALSQDQQESLDYIFNAGLHLKTLIEDVLDLARIESGHLTQTPSLINLVSVINEVIGLSALDIQSKQLSITTLFPESDIWVHLDKVRLKQVMLNFLNNAVKYNRDQGNLDIKVAMLDSEEVRIRFADSGIGIPKDKQSLLFTPFQRLGHEASNIPGSGIGLVLAQRLVKGMGGRIEFESQENIGSQFDVILPVSDPVTLRSSDVSARPKTNDVLRNLHILYVDDEEASICLMNQFVDKRNGWKVTVARNGVDAFQLAQKLMPDVILMALNLPDMNGLELAVLLKGSERVEHTPVIAFTGDGRYEVQLACEYAGVELVHTKPIDFVVLEDTLHALMSGSGDN